MNEIINANTARINLEGAFKGLPHAHALLVQVLISRADPNTGCVDNITYRDLSELLAVTPAPGRKDSGTPKKQTVRNYLSSIEKQCGNDFKVLSDHQKLRIVFTSMPGIYAEVNTGCIRDLSTNSSCESPYLQGFKAIDEDFSQEDNTQGNTEVNTQVNTEVNILGRAIKNNNINNKNIITTTQQQCFQKKIISKNFYPSAETIAKSLERGYDNVCDASTIDDFINKNIAWGSQFADFNPVYLLFLARHRERQTSTSPCNFEARRRATHERASHKKTSFEQLLAAVQQANANAIAPSDARSAFDISAFNGESHCRSLVGAY